MTPVMWKRCAVAVLVTAIGIVGEGAKHSAAESNRTAASATASGTVWLCRPGLAHNPCIAPLDATVVQATGAVTVRQMSPAANSPFDCFFVYPTVSKEKTANADLQVQPAEIAAAAAEASPFSQVCRVWAPVYRQETDLTLARNQADDPRFVSVAYQSVLAAWQDYLAHDNAGRPVVFIGHSQGAAMLSKLLASQVDPSPSLRRQVVSAILLGGNVLVPDAPGGLGSFKHLAPCRSALQAGCVIAYSSFPSQPPADALFGRPGQGPSAQSGQMDTIAVKVLCVNPVALGGGVAGLDTLVPMSLLPANPRIKAPWIEFPNLYTATCKSADGASWLNVTPTSQADPRPRIAEAWAKTQGPMWGFHGLDEFLALGNLVHDVVQQEAAYRAPAS